MSAVPETAPPLNLGDLRALIESQGDEVLIFVAIAGFDLAPATKAHLYLAKERPGERTISLVIEGWPGRESRKEEKHHAEAA